MVLIRLSFIYAQPTYFLSFFSKISRPTGIRPDRGSDRVIVRRDWIPPTSNASAPTPNLCKCPRKGDVILSVNGKIVFDINTMDVCGGFSMRPVADLITQTQKGKPLILDLLRPAHFADNGSNSAAVQQLAVPARSQDVEELKEDDDADDEDDVMSWKGTDEFLKAAQAAAQAAIAEATVKYNEATSAAATSKEDAVAIMIAEHNQFVKNVNIALARNKRELNVALAKLDQATKEKARAKREYQELILLMQDKERMISVIEARRRQLDEALAAASDGKPAGTRS